MIEVTRLFVYPVKGLRGIELGSAELTAKGLRYDRQWMLVMPNGRMVTQRQLPQMARLATRITDQSLVITNDAGVELNIPLAELPGDLASVTVWRDEFQAQLESAQTGEWLTAALDAPQPLRLARLPEQRIRPSNKTELAGHSAAFADAAPFLVTNQASLDALNQQLQEQGLEQVPMERFRPNLVVEGLDAFAEYQGGELRAANYRLGLQYPSERCVVITTDQFSGERNEAGEPLNTLREMETLAGTKGAYFGENAVLLNGAGETITVGDQFEWVSA